MTARELFSRCKCAGIEANLIKKQIENVDHSVKSPSLSAAPGGSGLSDPTSQVVILRDELMAKYEKKLEKYFSLLATCEDILSGIRREDYRVILRMHYFDELSYRQIARRRHYAEGTVGNLMHKALKAAEYVYREMEKDEQ